MLKYFVIFLLSGCALLPTNTVSRSIPIDTTIVNSQVYITWIRFDVPAKVEMECMAMGIIPKPRHRIVACSAFDLKKRTCTIFALNPKVLDGDEMTVLGHEMKHCFDGAFHD